MNPKAARFTRLNKLLAASGPLLTWAVCHAAIWCFHRSCVRPSLDRIVLVLEVTTEFGDPLHWRASSGSPWT